MKRKNYYLLTGLATLLVAGSASAASADTYTVKSGDTLSKIATEKQTTIDTIVKLNHLKNPNLIHIGQVLELTTGTSNDFSEQTVSEENSVNQTQNSVVIDASSEQEKSSQTVIQSSEVLEEKQVASSETVKLPEASDKAISEQPSTQETEMTPVSSEQAPVTVAEPEGRTEELTASQESSTLTTTSSLSSDEQAAKEWIAQKESSGSYTAQNGIYYGRYQLTLSYLNGDLSPENQERVADEYVKNRYGSWVQAHQFWLANGWY